MLKTLMLRISHWMLRSHKWNYNPEDWIVEGSTPNELREGIYSIGVETKTCNCGIKEYRSRRNVSPTAREDKWQRCKQIMCPDGIKRFSEPYRPTLAGFGSCPNCEVNWGVKKLRSGSIKYDDQRSGVLICEDCLSEPGRLDDNRICNKLSKSGWSPAKVELVRKAVLVYKTTKI